MTAPATIAWGALCVFLYGYFGYPLLLAVLARLRRGRPLALRDIQPRVTMVVTAWNEDQVIAEKIENTLALDYPPDKLDLIVVSDGSTDLTDEIVTSYAQRPTPGAAEGTGRVRLLHTAGRQGKSAALNLGVPEATGEIVVLTDANAVFQKDAIARLVRPFGDSRVGAVSGQLHYHQETALGEGEGAYWRYEQAVKRSESALRSLLGANGSIYAIRKRLFRPVHPRDVNDFRIPYDVLLQGYWVVLEPEAVSFEHTAGNLWAEYRRKVRIMARAIPMMLALIWPTLARRRLLALWQLLSHKLLREIQGLFFLGALGGAAWGAVSRDLWLSGFLAAQVALYLLGTLGWALPSVFRWRPARLAAHFNMIALASVAALWLWLTGRVRPTWAPARPKG
jgi:cellulose synthase/poly-beta-1,6-N-acetylglucosamine synthase-like glycosyltransferase